MQVLRQDVSRPTRDDPQGYLRSGESLQNIKNCSITAAHHNSVGPVLDCVLRLGACSSVCPGFQKLDLDTNLFKNIQDTGQIARAT
jgi:hypothetical protein